jgi:hypothetical protein
MIRLAVFAVMLALVAAGCSGGNKPAPKQSPATSAAGATSGVPGPRQLTDLRDIGQLRSLFNMRSDEPRLILLASPT